MSAETDLDDKVIGQSPSRERAANADRPPRTQSAPHTESDGNSIQASRRRRLRHAPGVSDETPAPQPRASDTLLRAQPGSKPGGTESDPWTVPQSVRDRFVQDGNRFYFPDGAAAFRDLGRKLTTGSENTEVVHSLIEIAQARGWSEVKVAGTERFRQEAWRQARLAGLGVRGYQPTHDEQARVVRTFARSLGRSMRPEEDIRAEAPVVTGRRRRRPARRRTRSPCLARWHRRTASPAHS